MAVLPCVARACGLIVPLNSKRFTVTHLRIIAKAMDLPTTASTDEVHQVVEGALSYRGKEPQNIQVAIGKDGVITLQDEDGPFLTIEEPEGQIESVEADDSEAETTAAGDRTVIEEDDVWSTGATEISVKALQRQTDELNHQNSKLESDLTTAREQLEAQVGWEAELATNLEHERQQRKQMWRLSCQQLSEHDELVAEKEAEIQRLKEELSRVRRSREPVSPGVHPVSPPSYTSRAHGSTSEAASDEDETGLERATKKR